MDISRHRKALAESLVSNGINDPRLVDALISLPRELFFPPGTPPDIVYQDSPYPIGFGQTISQPTTVASQTALLDVQKGYRILEVGTGSGFQAALLALLGAEVHTVERIWELYIEARSRLENLCLHRSVHAYYGDGYQGLQDQAPFDRILITAAAPVIPHALVSQLKPGGIMVLPLDDVPGGLVQHMTKLVRTSGGYELWQGGSYRFVPMLHGLS